MQKTPSKFLARFFFLGIFLFFLGGGLAFWLLVHVPEGTKEEDKKAQQRLVLLKALREEEEKALYAPKIEWWDKEKGLVRIPIEQAMVLEVEFLKQKPLAPAYPIFAQPVSL